MSGHLVQHMSQLDAVDASGPLVIVSGDGARVSAADGTVYLDGVSGLVNVNVGHGREELAEAAAEAMRRLAYGTLFFGMATEPAVELAAELARITPAGIERFFFALGGSDANDSALKIARRYHALRGKPEKTRFLARADSYHGMTFGGTSASGDDVYRDGFGPFLPGVVHAPQPGADGVASAAELEALIVAEGPETIAALIAEPVSLPAAVNVPPDDYWPAVREICTRHDILLIADEVVTGFGRTGRMFGMDHWDVTPDLMTMSKGITSGYLPLAAVGMTKAVYDVLASSPKPFLHGFTTGGHPTCCALALANLAIIEREDLAGNAERRGAYFRARLDVLCATSPSALRARNLGLLVALDLSRPEGVELRAGLSFGAHVRNEMLRRGVIMRFYGDTLVWGPSLAITEAEIDELVDGLAATLDALGG